MSNDTNPQVKKNKSIIRWGALIPFVVICLLIALYTHFFLDTHLRLAMQWAGYEALGAEVDVADVETSFWNASLVVRGIEITDAEQPSLDSIKIGDVKFSMLWDALLRARVVINEASIEQIEFAVPRKHPGRVKPPEPVSNKPGFLSEQAQKLKGQALQQAQQQYNDNVLGDVVAMLGGTDPNAQLKQLQENLPSKAMLEKFQADFQIKQKNWNQKLKALPQGKDIQALGDRLNKVKYKDFKNVQELQHSLQELDGIFKDADAKYKQIQSTSNDLNKDLKETDAQYKALQEQIKSDIKDLETHFRIPKLDAKELSRGIFLRYLSPYLAKFNRYRGLAEKYLPPKFTQKGASKSTTDVAIQPHPREIGTTYEFGRPNSYPMFWIRHTAISSRAGASPYAGNIKGEIRDISSNQSLVGRPTILTLQGDFPAQQITGILLQMSLDNTQDDSLIEYRMNVGSYPLRGRDLVQSPDVQIAFAKAQGTLKMDGRLLALRNFTLNMDNQFSRIDYQIAAKNQIADQILKAVFNGIPVVNLEVKGEGHLPGISLDISSNLGPELQKGFEKQIQAKIAEARQKIQAYIDQQIGQQKAQVDAEIMKAKTQVNQEIQKAQAQLESQKKQAENKVDQAKKDASRQGQKQLEQQGKKALDDLKKKLGW